MSATVTRPLGSRKVSPPVKGSARWVKKLANDFGRLAITSYTKRGPVVTEYDVQLNRDERGQPLGYVLAKDDDTVYDLPADLSACDCHDCLCRDRECKHLKGLRAALAQL